jgi:hypothetical protein
MGTGTGDRRHGWRPGIVDHGDDARPLDAGWTRRRADAVWASNNPGQPSSKDYEGHHASRTGLPPPRPSAAGSLRRWPSRASAHCSPRNDFRSSVDRDAGGHPVHGEEREARSGVVGRRSGFRVKGAKRRRGLLLVRGSCLVQSSSCRRISVSERWNGQGMSRLRAHVPAGAVAGTRTVRDIDPVGARSIFACLNRPRRLAVLC